jgi:DNA polymerase I-like protein with 3'-5' exonuclease and polymerase domains
MKHSLASMDTETTGLDTYHGCRPFLVSACTGKSNYVWEGEVDPSSREVEWRAAEVRDLLKFINNCEQLVFHNRNFDIRMIATLGIGLLPNTFISGYKQFLYPDKRIYCHDTIVASHVVCSGSRKVGHPHGLKDLCIKYFGYDNSDEEVLQQSIVESRSYLSTNEKDVQIARVGHPHFPAATEVSWAQDMWLDMNLCKRYAVKDGERTILLHKTLQKRIADLNMYQQYLFRMRLLDTLYDIQTTGITLYTNKVDRVLAELDIQIPQLVELMRTEAKIPYSFDPANHTDLHNFLYVYLKLPILKTTETGKAATDAGTLNALEKQYADVKAIRYFRNWRKATKIRTDIDTYKKWAQTNEKPALHISNTFSFDDDSRVTHYDTSNNNIPNISNSTSTLSNSLDTSHSPHYAPKIDDLFRTDRIHSTINLTGTKWTRQSSSDPNQQNFNKKLGFLFGPSKGFYWLYADVVNIELRIWAYEVGSKPLIEKFEQGESVHIIIAQALYPEMLEKLGIDAFKETKTYTKCKSGTFARIYGGGKAKVDDTYGIVNACAIIDEKIPEVGRYFAELEYQMNTNAEYFDYPSIFTIQGYKLDVPVTAPHSVPSARIQGTAGLIVQEMMIELTRHPRYKDPMQIQTPPTSSSSASSVPSVSSSALPFPPSPYYATSLPHPLQCHMIQQVHDSITIEIPCHKNSQETNEILISVMEKVGCRTIPTCPMDYTVIECHEDEEPYFKDYLFIPVKHSGYEIEMFIHNHAYLCIATYDKDTIIKQYAPTKQQAYEAVIKEIENSVPF